MLIKSNSNERDTRSIDTLKRLTEIVVVCEICCRVVVFIHVVGSIDIYISSLVRFFSFVVIVIH